MIVEKQLMLEMLVDESLEMIVDESLDMTEDESLDIIMDESLMVEDKSLEKLIDETLKLDDEHFESLIMDHKVEKVQFHLFRNGIDLSYTKWNKHGEKDKPSISAPKPVNATTEFVDDMDFASDIPTDGPATVEMVNATKDNFDEDDLVKFQELLLDTENPLYKGCPDFTKLSAIVKLLNLKGKYGASDKFFTELLGLIKKMLSTGISADGVDVNRGNMHHRYPRNDIDVFLEPLIDDLHTLFETWDDTYGASTKDNFNLCVIVLWTINEYPVLGTLYGCPFSGFKGCVVCGKDTYCVRLFASSKQSYGGHRRYLPYNHAFKKQKKAFNGQQEFLLAPNPMTREQIYNEVQHIENKWGKRKCTSNKALENQEDMRDIGGNIQKQKRNTSEEEGSLSQVNEQNVVYWKKFNIWYFKLRYWRHNFVPQCIDLMHVKTNVVESLVGNLLNVLGKTKDGVNARLDLAKLGVKPELFSMQEEDKTTLPPVGYTLTNAKKDIFCETLYNMRVPQGYFSNFSSLVSLKDRKVIGLKSHDYHMLIKEIRLQELDKMQEELVVTLCLLKKFFPSSFFDIIVHLTVHLTRKISYGPLATVVKYDAYNINRYTFRMECHDGKVDQNNRVSVEAIDLYISKEVVTTRQAFYYEVLQEIWLLDYRFKKIPLFKCDWVNHRAGGVKRDTTLGYTLVDLNNLGHKVNPLILASQARQVFYLKDQTDKKSSIIFKTPLRITKIYRRDLELIVISDSLDDNNGPSIPRVPVYGPLVQGLLENYGYDNIEDYLSDFYFPSTNKEDTIVHTGQDPIHECHSPKSKAKYVPVLQKHNPNVKSPIAITRCMLGLPNVDTWDDILKKFGMRTHGRCADKWMNGKDYGKDNHHVFCIYSSDDSKVAKKPILKVIFKSPIPIKGYVLGLANVKTWDNIVKKFGMRKPGKCADKSKGKRKGKGFSRGGRSGIQVNRRGGRSIGRGPNGRGGGSAHEEGTIDAAKDVVTTSKPLVEADKDEPVDETTKAKQPLEEADKGKNISASSELLRDGDKGKNAKKKGKRTISEETSDHPLRIFVKNRGRSKRISKL
ncbi:putative transposon, En/Spm-like protein [Tanacetum coccineum]